jgi:hypothetical protein
MINDLKLIENIDILLKSRIILYGAGLRGIEVEKTLKKAGISAAYFCDGNPEKQGKAISGIEIISPEDLKELDKHEKNAIIIASDSIANIEQIISVLENIQVNTDNVFTALGVEIAVFQNINHTAFNEEFRAWFACKVNMERVISEKFNEYWLLKNLYKVIDNSAVWIYQSGKVGSSTMYKSLDAVSVPCSQAHMIKNIDLLCNDEIHNELFLNLMEKGEIKKIITLIREPLSRNISAFFEYLGRDGPSAIPHGNSFLYTCNKWIKGEFSELKTKIYNMLDWFDQELKAAVGVDVFAHPFDREKGYSVIKQGNIEVLVIKLEKLNSLESVISDFVGAPDFKLITANEASSKPIKYLYKNVREAIKIPRETVNLYYKDNPRMNHFYTEEEKVELLKKWEKNIVD